MARILASIAALLTLFVAASLAIVLRPLRRRPGPPLDDGGGGGGARRRPDTAPGAGAGEVAAPPAIRRRLVPRQKHRPIKRGARRTRSSRGSRT